jgi:uncharacterized protein YbjQ (UPF0145 family)
MKNIILFSGLLILLGCSSRSIKPDIKEVKVSRDEPSSKCHEIGNITGTTLTAKGTQDDAIEDLKHEAANKGANYVLVKQFSSYGTTVTGRAFECP